MTIRDQIQREGGPAAFARLTGIPYRTVQAWWRQGHADGRTPPAWLAPLVRDALRWRKDNDNLERSERSGDTLRDFVGMQP